jgi:hypothetical protein
MTEIETYRFTLYTGDMLEETFDHVGQAIGRADDDDRIAYVTDLQGRFIHGDADFLADPSAYHDVQGETEQDYLQDGRQSVAALEAADTTPDVPAWMLETPTPPTERTPLPPPPAAGWWTLPTAAWAWSGDARTLED